MPPILDCNLSFGRYAWGGPARPCETVGELRRELARAGMSGGLVRHSACDSGGAATGNRLLGESLRETGVPLWGVWSLLPSCTGEFPDTEALPALMAARGIRAIGMNPEAHRFLPLPQVVGNYLEMMSERKIPLMLDTGRGLSLEQAFALMRAFPSLTAILTYADCWPSDRLLRPFLEGFPNLCLDMAYILTDRGVESLVERYGAGRLLLGSGFPGGYLGAHLLAIRHSDISEEEKALILGGNLARIVEGEALV
jgi:hypothetical protein